MIYWGQLSRDNLVRALIFLFPIAGNTVRHWHSSIFVLLSLFSLAYLIRKPDARKLATPERAFLWALAGFFLIFIVSAIVNGWTQDQWRALGVEIRFLLAVPIYLMVRAISDIGIWLVRGTVIAGLLLGGQVFYETVILGHPRAYGIYFHLLLGPVAVLSAFITIHAWPLFKNSSIWRYLIPVSVILAFYAAAFSFARSAYLAIVLLTPLSIYRYFQGRTFVAVMLAAIIAIGTIYSVSDKISMRVNTAFDEVREYMQIEDPAKHPGNLKSSAMRLEMWRVAFYQFMDNPILGVGGGNYNKNVKTYVEKGIAHRNLAKMPHTHNAFFEALVTKGIIGFGILMFILLFPLYYFVRYKKIAAAPAWLGITTIIAISVFSLTESAAINKGNFVAIFTLYLAVFFSWLMNEINKKNMTSGNFVGDPYH